MKLSIIIPTYNEEMTIEELVSLVQSVKYPVEYEIIIVDDASIDRTFEREIMLKLRDQSEQIRIFKNQINRGKGFSVRKGIRRAKGDIIIVQDADREYDPREIPKLIEPILKGAEQVVYGSRFMTSSRPRGMAFANRFANQFLTMLTNWMFGLKLTDMETCYKAIRADLLKSLPLQENRFAFEPEITGLLALKHVPIMEMPISYSGRTSKEGKKIKAVDFLFAIWALVRCRFWSGLGD